MGVTGIFGICADFSGEILCESARPGVDATPGVVGSPGNSNMYPVEPRCTPVSGRQGPSGYLSPRFQPSSAGSERDEDFDATKILPVADDHDLAAHVNFQFFQLLEILRRAVVGIDHVGFHISRWRHAVERHDHAGIVLVWIVVHALASRPMHFDTGGRSQAHADLGGIVDPDFVFDDFGFEPGVAEFLRHVVGGGLVLDRSCHVRIFGQNAEMLLRQLGIGHGQKARLDGGLGGGIAESEDRRRSCRGRICRRRAGQKKAGDKQNDRK
jgi:hypothetical protein